MELAFVLVLLHSVPRELGGAGGDQAASARSPGISERGSQHYVKRATREQTKAKTNQTASCCVCVCFQKKHNRHY